MRILVGWDKVSEADTIALYLNMNQNAAKVTTDPTEFVSAVKTSWWDVVLMSLDFPSTSESFSLFQKIRELQASTPIVGVCYPGQVYRLAQFLDQGMESYVVRDVDGEFIFLLAHAIDSAYALVTAGRVREVANRLQHEIESVRRLQKSMIPRDLPIAPGYGVAARYEPSQIEVVGNQPIIMAGGDYHDVFTLGQNRLALLISDASGHGMKACMSIMVMHALVQLLRDQRHQNTAEFVAAVNRRMCESDIVRDEGGFITLLYCILDTSKHTMEWTSAGHPVAMLHDLAANQVIQIEDSDAVGLPLGIAADVTYEACSTTLPENCRLLLYTDGLAEAFPVDRGERQQFGRAGIVFTLRATAKLPVRDALDMLFVASSAFAGGNGRQDDTSAILVERTSGATPPVPATELSKKGQTRIYT